MKTRFALLAAVAAAAVFPTTAHAEQLQCVSVPKGSSYPWVRACGPTTNCLASVDGVILADSYCVPRGTTCVSWPYGTGYPPVIVCAMTTDCVVAVGGTIFADSYCVPRP